MTGPARSNGSVLLFHRRHVCEATVQTYHRDDDDDDDEDDDECLHAKARSHERGATSSSRFQRVVSTLKTLCGQWKEWKYISSRAWWMTWNDSKERIFVALFEDWCLHLSRERFVQLFGIWVVASNDGKLMWCGIFINKWPRELHKEVFQYSLHNRV